jgi:hypothetical protein
MQKAFCFLALSACFFACQRQQAGDEVLAQIQAEVPVPAEGPEKIENTPTPTNLAATPSPVESITPQPEASVTPTATETPILSPTQTPTISSTPEATVQTPEPGEKPVASSKPRLRLNPLSTGTPFPQATVSAEFSLTSSPVTSPVPSETGPPAQKTATATPAASSWIRSASGKKRASPSVSPSPSPSQ